MKKITVGMIGGGNMGSAIIAGIYKKFAVGVCEQDQERAQALKQKYKVGCGDLKTIVAQSKIIILAVKPQNFDDVLGQLRSYLTKDHLVISIAAGITCAYIEKRLAGNVRVIRTMPNLPAQVAQAMTGMCRGQFATEKDLTCASQIFSNIGKIVLVDEKFMDALTAVSGSGPAYVFLFIECLQKAGVRLGFSDEISKLLVYQTFQGALSLLEKENVAASILRERVTSKGGTTQAALDVFEKNKIEKIFTKALLAARKRAKELAKK